MINSTYVYVNKLDFESSYLLCLAQRKTSYPRLYIAQKNNLNMTIWHTYI